jgi:hypothetical protein
MAACGAEKEAGQIGEEWGDSGGCQLTGEENSMMRSESPALFQPSTR